MHVASNQILTEQFALSECPSGPATSAPFLSESVNHFMKLRWVSLVVEVQERSAKLEECGLVERLREDVSHHQFSTNPVRIAKLLKEHFTPKMQPAIVVAVASIDTDLLDCIDSRSVIGVASERFTNQQLKAI